MHSRWFNIAKRWAEIIFYAAIAAAVTTLAYELIPSRFCLSVLNANLYWQSVVLGTTALVWLFWTVGFRFGHLRQSHRYPPLIFAAIAAVTGLEFWFKSQNSEWPNFLDFPKLNFAFGALVSALALTGVLRLLREKMTIRKNKLTRASTPRLQQMDAPHVIEWTKREVPIESAEADLLNVNDRAKKLLGLLQKDEHVTIAIVGPYGAGKTSLTKIIQEYNNATDSPNFIFSWVSCWGFKDSVATQEEILDEVVANLGRTADCFAINGMPSRFVDALSKTSNYLESAFRLASATNPDEQLQRLTPIPSCLSKRLLVVIEDTDRQGKVIDLSAIEGLLSRFRKLTGISFIITAGPDAKIDFVRLCEHIEVIPELDPDLCIGLIDTVRSYCKGQFSRDIDPIKRRDTLRGPTWAMRAQHTLWEAEMVRLISTPRKLKTTLRQFYDAWQVLHGEVDIDELLMASCLRVCAPPVFSFLTRRYSELWRIRKDPERREGTKALLTALENEWDNLPAATYDVSAAANLLQALDESSSVLFKQRCNKNYEPVQSFRSSRAVYRDRLFNESLRPGISDQIVLHKINDALSTKDWKPIAADIESSIEFSEIFDVFFKSMFNRTAGPADVWLLVIELFRILREKYGASANENSSSFVEASQLAMKCYDHTPQFFDKAFSLVEACVPNNLELACDIFHRLIASNVETHLLNEYSKRFVDCLRHAFSGKNPEIIASGISSSNVVTLYEILKTGAGPKPDYNQWQWLGSILLQGIQSNRDFFAPQIAVAIGLTFDGDGMPEGFLLNDNVLKGVFGGDSVKIVSELAKPFEFDKTVPLQFGIDFSIANDRAKGWLKAQANQSQKPKSDPAAT